MKKMIVILMFLMTGLLNAQDTTKVDSKHVQEFFYASIPDDMKDKQWNRWTTKNFVICSINDGQAQYLHNNLEKIKSWLITRWGFDDFDFPTESRLICVDDPALFEKMFKITSSRVEDKDKVIAVFLLLDDKPAKTVPGPITEVFFLQFEKKFGYKLPMWFQRGMIGLNSTVPDIRKNLSDLNALVVKDSPMFFTKDLLSMTPEKYSKMPQNQKDLFDKNSLAFTLMVRKEFGQEKTKSFIKNSNIGLIGFANNDQLDLTYKKYMIDLTNSIVGSSKKITPDSYLQIKKETK